MRHDGAFLPGCTDKGYSCCKHAGQPLPDRQLLQSGEDQIQPKIGKETRTKPEAKADNDANKAQPHQHDAQAPKRPPIARPNTFASPVP
ncbi:MAG: hypothetical protein RSE12_06565 [Fuscovulum sp.]|nr:MAG: hypothetical protein RSE12_06565 [Fuscovulum sp.]